MIRFGLENSIRAYDASYLALAEGEKASLITADEKLIKPVNKNPIRISSLPPTPSSSIKKQVLIIEPHHQAFEGVLCGGIIGTLLDCHSNWTSAWHLMVQNGLDQPPCAVTGEFAVKLLKPTPIDDEVELSATVIESTKSKAVIEAALSYRGEVTATCRGTFFAVKPGHPAYHQR